MLEMANVGDIADIAHLIAKMLQVAIEDIEGDSRSCMSEVCVTIDGRSADIHSDMPLMKGFESLLETRERVIDL